MAALLLVSHGVEVFTELINEWLQGYLQRAHCYCSQVQKATDIEITPAISHFNIAEEKT